jgi:hypothetical protein
MQKTIAISFTLKTNNIQSNYRSSNFLILNADCTKNDSVLLDSNLYFLNMLIIHLLSILKILYNPLIWPKPEYASAAWNSLTLADSNKLENTENKS